MAAEDSSTANLRGYGGLVPPGLELAALDFEFLRRAPGEAEIPVQIGIALTRGGEPAPDLFWGASLNPLWRAKRAVVLENAVPLIEAGDTARRVPQRDVLEQPAGLLECWREIAARLSGRVLLAHGAAAEKRMLRAFPGHSFGPWIDTLVLSRAVLPGAGGHSLGELCAALGVEKKLRLSGLCGDWHEAVFDAAACLLLFYELVKRLDLPREWSSAQWLKVLGRMRPARGA